MKNKISWVLAFLSMQVQAQTIKPEHIIPDIGEYTIVQAFPCTPDGYKATMACLVIEKDGKQLGAIHDPQTKECYELREEGRKVIWKKGWILT